MSIWWTVFEDELPGVLLIPITGKDFVLVVHVLDQVGLKV